MDDSYQVWTLTNDPAWLAKNANCADVLIAVGLSLSNAHGLVERLGELYGDHNAVVHPANERRVPTMVRG